MLKKFKYVKLNKKCRNKIYDLLDIILTDKILESERQEDKNDNENEN